MKKFENIPTASEHSNIIEKREIPTDLVLDLVHKMREGQEATPDYKESAVLWHNSVVEGNEPTDRMFAELVLAQQAETPPLVSAVLERTCNLSCEHCLYQDEKSSATIGIKNRLHDSIENIVSQLPETNETNQPQFLSAGRIMRPSHLELFRSLRDLRPDVALGVIDNGSYTRLLKRWPAGFHFNWMDISVDGLRETHNTQRGSENAYDLAIDGLRKAREVTLSPKEGGRVTSLMTLTKLNVRDIEGVAEELLNGNEPLADQLNITTMAPTNERAAVIEADESDVAIVWKTLQRLCPMYGDRIGALGIYRTEDIDKLARVIGEKKFYKAFTERVSGLAVNANFIYTTIDGVPIQYQPISIWPPEEFLIDADGALRVAKSGQYTLEELRSGRSKTGDDVSMYTAEQLTPESNFVESYKREVELYWHDLGRRLLQEEAATWTRIRES